MIGSFDATILSKIWVEHVMIIKLQINNDPNLLPGQFINVLLPEKIARAYSVAKVEIIEGKFILTLAIEYIPTGRGSEYFKSLNVFDQLHFKSPFGRFIPTFIDFKSRSVCEDNTKENQLMIATGTGIVPLLSMLQGIENNLSGEGYFKLNKQISKLKNIKLFFGLKHNSEIYFQEDLEDFVLKFKKLNINFNYEIWISRDENSLNYGRVNKGIDKIKDILNNSDIYISGSKEIVISIKEYLLLNNAKDANIFIERFN